MQQITTQAPGRINIIGEHTDYNDGFVLPAAIDKIVRQTISKNGNESGCKLTSEHFGESIQFDLKNIKSSEKGWANYLLGVVVELQKRSNKLGGFDCKFGGNVPLGGGVSSSSALQVSFVFALNELFGLGFSKIEMAKICQDADHNFTGVRGGIMDQFTSLHGIKNQVMLLDCRSLEYQYFPLDLGDYQLLLLNTNVSHSLADSDYNTRRSECEAGVEIIQKEFPNVTHLRDVSTEQLFDFKSKLPETVFRRCHHVVTEDVRTLKATEAMKNGNFQLLGELMYASHESLTTDYEVSCPELDFLVDFSKDKNYVLGSRMMGGGFGGCTISLVEKSKIKVFIAAAEVAYREKFGKDLTPMEVTIEDGAKVV